MLSKAERICYQHTCTTRTLKKFLVKELYQQTEFGATQINDIVWNNINECKKILIDLKIVNHQNKNSSNLLFVIIAYVKLNYITPTQRMRGKNWKYNIMFLTYGEAKEIIREHRLWLIKNINREQLWEKNEEVNNKPIV